MSIDTRPSVCVRSPATRIGVPVPAFERTSYECKRATGNAASDTPYDRWWGIEVLDCNPESVRLDRLNDGAALRHPVESHRTIHDLLAMVLGKP